ALALDGLDAHAAALADLDHLRGGRADAGRFQALDERPYAVAHLPERLEGGELLLRAQHVVRADGAHRAGPVVPPRPPHEALRYHLPDPRVRVERPATRRDARVHVHVGEPGA